MFLSLIAFLIGALGILACVDSHSYFWGVFWFLWTCCSLRCAFYYFWNHLEITNNKEREKEEQRKKMERYREIKKNKKLVKNKDTEGYGHYVVIAFFIILLIVLLISGVDMGDTCNRATMYNC